MGSHRVPPMNKPHRRRMDLLCAFFCLCFQALWGCSPASQPVSSPHFVAAGMPQALLERRSARCPEAGVSPCSKECATAGCGTLLMRRGHTESYLTSHTQKHGSVGTLAEGSWEAGQRAHCCSTSICHCSHFLCYSALSDINIEDFGALLAIMHIVMWQPAAGGPLVNFVGMAHRTHHERRPLCGVKLPIASTSIFTIAALWSFVGCVADTAAEECLLRPRAKLSRTANENRLTVSACSYGSSSLQQPTVRRTSPSQYCSLFRSVRCSSDLDEPKRGIACAQLMSCDQAMTGRL